MLKELKVNKKKEKFKMSAAVPILYARTFDTDFFADIKSILDDEEMTGPQYEKVFQIAYVMWIHANKEQSVNFDNWLSNMEFDSIEDVTEVIIEMYYKNIIQKSEPKKAKGQ